MKKYRVTSQTDKKVKYIVTHFIKKDKFVCNCPAYTFGKLGYQCKHVKKVRKYLEKQNEQ